MGIKAQKAQRAHKDTKRQTSDLLPLRCFYAYKNAIFFFFTHTKKHIKSTKTHIREQATSFPLDVF